MNASDQTDALATALAKAQATIAAPGKNREVTVKTKTGGSYKFKYATLDHLIEHVRKPLTENGIWFVQFTEPGQMVTRLTHGSGQWIDSAVPMPNLPNAPQEAGSILTYFRRYSLSVALGLASDEDDDANVAEGNGYLAQERKPAPRQKLDGPYTSKTALWQAFKSFDRELRGCGDSGEFEGLLGTDDAKALIAQCERDAPQLLEGGIDLPDEFIPLKTLIAQRRKDFSDLEQFENAAGNMRAG